MALGRYEEAFEEAQALLDRWDVVSDQGLFFEPWMGGGRPRSPAFYADRLAELESMASTAPRTPWSWFYQGLVLCLLRRTREGLRALDAASASDMKRFGWMRWASGSRRLQLGHLDDAVDDFRAAMSSRPLAWWARCHLAEALFCRGEVAEALREFDAALGSCGREGQGDILAWKGAVLLWAGRYEEALTDLDAASARGSNMAACWKGGALMLLGRDQEALRQLDGAIATCGRDAEAMVFRGELRRRLGMPEAAREDLAVVIGWGSNVWATINLALLAADAGDRPGFWRHLESVPSEFLDAAGRRLGEPGWKGMDDRKARRALETALAMARGVRRMDGHLRSLYFRS